MGAWFKHIYEVYADGSEYHVGEQHPTPQDFIDCAPKDE